MSWNINEFIRRGDAEAAVIDILENITPELDVYDPMVAANLIGYTPDQTWIEVIQSGSIIRWPKISRTRIDVDVRAPDRTTAIDVNDICLASIFRQGGVYAGNGLKIVYVRLEAGPYRLPEKNETASRYFFSLRITTVPFGVMPTPS